MINQMSAIANFQGQSCYFNGNEPILLNDPQTIWLVKSGSVALFAVTVKNGVIKGTRRYLFSCQAEEALFGTAVVESEEKQNQLFLAVPIGEIQLLKIDREFFTQLVTKGDAGVVALVENWLHKINIEISHLTSPSIQVRGRGSERYSLIDAQNFQPDPGTIIWVQIQQGKVCWMGFEEITLDTKAGIVPLSSGMWLTTTEQVQLVTSTTHEVQHINTLVSGLSQLHAQILQYITLKEQQEKQQELHRLYQRETSNRQVTVEALSELASPLRKEQASLFSDGAPLLVAAGAVGKSLGVLIRPPSRSENLDRVKQPLEAIVRASRLRMRQVLLRDNWWEKDCGPLIAYTQTDNKPLALLPVAANRYEIFDPIERNRVPANKDNITRLNPVAYMFYRSLPDKALNAMDVLRFALKGRGKDLLGILVTGVVATLLGMVTPYATGILIDNAIPDSDRGLLLQVGLGLLVATIGTALFRLAQGFTLLRVETTTDASTQTATWDRLLNLSVSFFRKYTTGDLQSRVTSISTIRRQLSGTTLITLITGLFAFLNLGLLFYYNVQLALVAVGVAIVSFGVTTFSGIFLVRKVAPLLELKGTIFGQTVQLINGISKLRVAGAEERAFAYWSKSYSKQIKLELSTQNIEDGMAFFNTVMPTLTSGILFWFTIQLLGSPSQASDMPPGVPTQTSGVAALTVGSFLAFNTAFTTFIKGSTDVSNTVTNILQVVPQWNRAQPILLTVPEVDLTKADPGKLTGKIKIDHVCFRYREDGPMTLDNVNLCTEPGEFIALVGGSGSGKSTIFRLLLGFETPQEGAIYYDNQDLSGLDIDAVRRQLGVVLQAGRIMSASIFDNIASGAQITLEEAWEAARMSGFADDVEGMPMQMHTIISEGGGNLSGGQRQRLLIARALVLKPRILLFDEATSALDNRTQAIVSESLDKLQVTRLVIAHRLSTIRNAHRIYVLQAGRVIQQGGFDELASQDGLFAQLMARQMA